MVKKEMEPVAAGSSTGQRGPVEHERRRQIVQAADEHFRHYGYNKTTIADLAKSIGLSSAYIYKFFDSKHAVGEAVCAQCLNQIANELSEMAEKNKSPADIIRKMFSILALRGSELYFENRKMHDIVVAALVERWRAVDEFQEYLLSLISATLTEGRASGAFERKTQLDEASRAIQLTLQPFYHPVLLEQNLDHIDLDAGRVAELVIRSLAP